MSNLHAAIGVAQLEQINKILLNKKKIFNKYSKEISKIKGLSIFRLPKYCKVNNWINLIQINKKKYKKNINQLIKLFTSNGIQVRPVWFPNHLQKPYKNFQRYSISKAPKIVSNYICLPSGANLKYNQIKLISKEIMSIIDK